MPDHSSHNASSHPHVPLTLSSLQVKEGGDVRLAALAELTSLTLTADNKLLMARDELGLVVLLIQVVKEAQGDERVRALGVLWNLTCGDRNEVPMARPELGLVSLLVQVVKEDAGEARVKALGALWNLTFAEQNKVPMASDQLGLVRALVDVARTSKGEPRVKALGALWKLTYADENSVPLARDELGLVRMLVQVAREEKGEARTKALGALWNLTFAPDNLVPMARDDLGLVELLIAVASSVQGQPRVYALGALGTLTHDVANKVPMAREELGLVTVLMKIIQEDTGAARVYSLGAIGNLTGAPENGVPLARDSLGLVALLIKVATDDNGEARVYALSALGNLTAGDGNQGPMARPELGLVPLLMSVAKKDTGEAHLYALGALQNLTHADINQEVMASEELGLVSLLITVAEEDNGEARVEALGALWNLSMNTSNCTTIVAKKGHLTMLKMLNITGGSVEHQELLTNALSGLIAMSRVPVAAHALKAAGAVPLMETLFESFSGAHQLRAAFVLAFLCGKDESCPEVCLLAVCRDLTDILLDVLERNLSRRGNEKLGYKFGNFELRVVLTAIATLCACGANMRILAAKSGVLIPLLVRVLELFVENAPPIEPVDGAHVGGGGRDIESAEASIEVLTRISFFYEDDNELRRAYAAIDKGLLAVVNAMAAAPTSCKVSAKCTKEAKLLVYRMTARPPSQGAPALSTDALVTQEQEQQHVVLSYESESGKEIAAKLASRLRDSGHDVWLRESGSTKVPAATDDPSDVMTALRASHIAVICVTQKYKENTLCQAEAMYASRLQRDGRLSLLYCNADSDYQKDANSMHGWLTDMIGQSSLQPLWEESHMQSMCEEVGSHAASKRAGSSKAAAVPALAVSPRAGSVDGPRSARPNMPRIIPGSPRGGESHGPRGARGDADGPRSPRADNAARQLELELELELQPQLSSPRINTLSLTMPVDDSPDKVLQSQSVPKGSVSAGLPA